MSGEPLGNGGIQGIALGVRQSLRIEAIAIMPAQKREQFA